MTFLCQMALRRHPPQKFAKLAGAKYYVMDGPAGQLVIQTRLWVPARVGLVTWSIGTKAIDQVSIAFLSLNRSPKKATDFR